MEEGKITELNNVRKLTVKILSVLDLENISLRRSMSVVQSAFFNVLLQAGVSAEQSEGIIDAMKIRYKQLLEQVKLEHPDYLKKCMEEKEEETQ